MRRQVFLHLYEAQPQVRMTDPMHLSKIERYLVGTVSTDQGHLSRDIIRIYHCIKTLHQHLIASLTQPLLTVQQLQQIFSLHSRPNLNPNRVLNPPKILNMRPIQLPGPIPDPNEMR